MENIYLQCNEQEMSFQIGHSFQVFGWFQTYFKHAGLPSVLQVVLQPDYLPPLLLQFLISVIKGVWWYISIEVLNDAHLFNLALAEVYKTRCRMQ